MMKLLCLATHDRFGKFTPGNVCKVTKWHINDEMTRGVVTIESDGVKDTTPFEFGDKNLITKTEAFRLMLVPVTKQ